MLNPTITPRKRGRPVNEARREEIIAVASRLFGERGLHATKMEHIAQELGISKLTLYSRFDHKEALFSAVIAAKSEEYISDDLFDTLEGMSAEASLLCVATSLMNLLTSCGVLGMDRMLMGIDSSERPKLTAAFYEAGPARVKRLIAEHFHSLHMKAALTIPDATQAANVFVAMIKGSDICMRTHLGIPPVAAEEDKATYCHYITRLFMTAHQA
jgi:TetR/AcrR family transcriptional regulator, mexJK operon transcriptional repressor